MRNTLSKNQIRRKFELPGHLPGVGIVTSDGIAPYQSTGFIGEHCYYFRSRNGTTTLELGSAGVEEFEYASDVYYSAKVHKPYEGNNSLMTGLKLLIPKLAPSPYFYLFPANEIRAKETEAGWVWESTSTPSFLGRDGFSPEEAYKNLRIDEKFPEKWEARNVLPFPLNHDYRVFPETVPDFWEIANTPLFKD